jgi:hypothetical protein
MTEKPVLKRMIVHFAGGAPLILENIPLPQIEGFMESLTEEPYAWSKLTTDEGFLSVLNRKLITWVEVQ